MKMNCEVVRDLLPLYADEVCSKESRGLVEEHLTDCPECRNLLKKLRETGIESDLQNEKKDVLKYGEKKFKTRSAQVGSVVAGIFMIPILICLIINLASGNGLGWFFIVLASLLVAASLIIVPLMVPEDKLFWTFCAFCASLMVLLAVVCLYTKGKWFWIASSATLFGLGLIFLPFVVKARPVRELIGNSDRRLIVIVLDCVLFAFMMSTIFAGSWFSFRSILWKLGIVAGVVIIGLETSQKRGEKK